MWIMRTSTSHAAFIHLFFRIHVLLQLELPDVKPPAMVAGEDSSRKSVWTWHSPGGFSTGHSIFQSRALLVVWRFLGEGDLTCGVTAHTHRFKRVQSLQSRKMKNGAIGVFWHFALWVSLKRFKRRLGSESGRYEYESPSWEGML